MSKSFFMTSTGSAVSVVDNTTRYAAFNGEYEPNATEVQRQQPIRSAGVLSNAYAYVSANDVNSASSCVITLMKNAAAQTMVMTYTANQTGIKEDTANTNTAAATDEISWRIVVASVSGTHNVVMQVIGVQFDPTTSSNCHTMLSSIGGQQTTASVTQYIILSGSPEPTATEDVVKMRIKGAFVASNLYTYVATNSRTTDVIFRSRVNGAFGNQTVTYTSGQTGVKEDASNTDSLADGNDFNFSITTSTGTQVINFQVVCATLISATALFIQLNGYSGGVLSQAINTTRYGALSGFYGDQATEANMQFRPRFTTYVGPFHTYVITNGLTSATLTLTVRDGGADSTLSIQYTTGQTGLKSDVDEGIVITSATDFVNYSSVVNNSGSGTILIGNLLVYGSDTAPVPAELPYLLMARTRV